MNITLALTHALLWFATGFAHPQVAMESNSQQAPTLPTDRVSHIELRNQTLESFLMESDIPWVRSMNIGFIYFEHPTQQSLLQGKKKFDLDLSSTTVGRVLDAVTKADGYYYWKQDGTVIDFIPKNPLQNSVDMAAKLSEKIKKFEIKDVSIHDAAVMLAKQAGAQGIAGLVEQKLAETGSTEGRPGWVPDQQDKFSFSLHDKTILECLNAIVSADPPAGWVAMPYRGEVLFWATARYGHRYHYQPNTEVVPDKERQPDRK